MAYTVGTDESIQNLFHFPVLQPNSIGNIYPQNEVVPHSRKQHLKMENTLMYLNIDNNVGNTGIPADDNSDPSNMADSYLPVMWIVTLNAC